MQATLYPQESRGHTRLGWLDSRHCFSFGDWFDRRRLHYGALRVLNDDRIEGGGGFGTHPHDNMEIITIGLAGTLDHKDSMGHTRSITPEEVQTMSAGTGLTHSEFNHSATEACHLLQIWIIPDRRGHTPRYDQRHFPAVDRHNRLQALVSPDGAEGTLPIHQRAWILRSDLDPGHSLDLPRITTGEGLYLYLVEGELEAAGQLLRSGDALTLDGPADPGEAPRVTALRESRLVVIRVPLA
jgi:redox-sensitive bicupin YhaK (pirin superfamily)